jgi:hypothetical protein
MASMVRVAKSAIKDALKRLGDAVKTRAGNMGDEYLIEGDQDDLLVRAGLMMAQSDESAADSSAEIASLRAENVDLRVKLAEAYAEIERLKDALHEEVVERIAGKLAANGETNPTADNVVMTALRDDRSH